MNEQQELKLSVVPTRERAPTRRSPLEIAMHCQLADLLRQFLHPDWKATHLPMGEYRTPETARRLKRMGVTAGWPDFMFVGPRCVFFLELKRAGGRLSDAQIEMRKHLIRCRFNYLVTSRLEDAVSTLQDLNILPRGIRVQ